MVSTKAEITPVSVVAVTVILASSSASLAETLNVIMSPSFPKSVLEALFEFACGEISVGFSASISIKVTPVKSSIVPMAGSSITPVFPPISVSTAPFKAKAAMLL